MFNKMKRHIYFLLILTLCVSELSARVIRNKVMLNGSTIPAEYTVLSDGTVGLGTGHNACISQYTIGRVTVPSQIKHDGKTYAVSQVMPMAFRLCDKLSVVIMQEGITRIGDFAFAGCSSLMEVEMPATMKSIASGAFIGAQNMAYLISKAATPPTWEYNDVFLFHQGGISDTQVQHFDRKVTLYVTYGSEEAYQTAKYSDSKLGWNTPEGWGTAFTEIKGSSMKGFRLYTPVDLYLLRLMVNNPGRYGTAEEIYLEGDIDMRDSVWSAPIGDKPEHALTVPFYGQGHYISNLRVLSDNVSGLIGYYSGKKISGIRLDNCEFRGKVLAGGLVAQCGACTIDSCYISSSVFTDGIGGGIVGRTTGKVSIDRCVKEGMMYVTTSGSNPLLGGFIGSTTEATVTNSACFSIFNHGSKSSIFIGECTAGGTATVDYCYSTNHELTSLPSQSNIDYGEHIILHGQPLSILDYAGDRHDFNYDMPYFQSVYPASVLGFQGWAYNHGQYPLPDCFTDLWPVKPNHAVYGSPTLAKNQVNVLTPDEEIPASAWLDLSDYGFRRYSFKASQLWIDGNMDVFGKAEQLPLGLARQITVENGIMLEDTLYAEKKGTVPVKEPVYQMDEQYNLVLDDKGEKICIDSLFLFDKILWEDRVYSLCLPYDVVFAENCALYQPTQIYDVDGETTALMERVRDNHVEAFRPYFLVVHNDTIPLGTHARTICPALDSKTMQLGEYEFEGTVTRKGNIAAREGNLYKLEDNSHWLRFKDSDDISSGIEPFTAYFRALGNNPAKRIKMMLDDNNPVISVGDFFYAINTKDPENVTATLMSYHGRGGSVVVPATAPYVLYGQERQVPLTDLSPDIFAKSTAQVWSIDMSQCADLKPVTIDRTAEGNPFYKVDERAIIYMPEGKAQPGKNNVIGSECQELTLTDKWDFCPPYGFHAGKASYDRILYASKQADGSYKSMAYTICLPFQIDLRDMDKIMKVLQLHRINEGKELLFSYDIPLILAGEPYVAKVMEGEVSLSATDVEVITQPKDISIYNDGDGATTGYFRGTFSRISNEAASKMAAYSLYSNSKWYRVRSDEGSYRDAYVDAFRSFYVPLGVPTRNSYNSVFQMWVQGSTDEENSIVPFPCDFFMADADFSKYDDDETGIDEVQSFMPDVQSEDWFTLDGRRLDGKPQTKGLYIYKGKKIVIK